MSIHDLKKLEKLSELKNKGIITEAEFEFKKFDLLNNKMHNINNMQIKNKKEGSYFLPILSFLIALISFFITLDAAYIILLFNDISALMFFIGLSFILGIISLSSQTNGTFLSVTSVILSGLSCLILLSTYNLIESLFG